MKRIGFSLAGLVFRILELGVVVFGLFLLLAR